MLILKEEIKKRNEDVVIFPPRSRGRRMVFKIDTDPSEYPKYKKLGFNIFRCSVCNSDSCYGCGDIVKDEENLSKNDLYVETGEDILTSPNNEIDISFLSLKELRELYPDIKASSKLKFIEKINENYE